MIASLDRCLIVEENFLIRQDLADMLRTLGFQTIDETASDSQALALIATVNYSAVFLYMIHADSSSQSLATALRDRNIPFVVTTAHLEPRDLPLSMQGAPVVQKPYSIDMIRSVLENL